MADGGGGSEGAGLAEPGRRAGSAGFTAGRDACRYRGDAGTEGKAGLAGLRRSQTAATGGRIPAVVRFHSWLSPPFI